MQKLRYFLISSLVCFYTQCICQPNELYKKYLPAHLKTSKLFTKPLRVDLNCDNVKDYALIFRKDKDNTDVYIIYSSGDTFRVQYLQTFDTTDLSINYCSTYKDSKSLQFKCNAVIVENWEWKEIYEFDPVLNKFKNRFDKHIGP